MTGKLKDFVGDGRDEICAAAALIEVERHITRGTMAASKPIDFAEAHAAYSRLIAEGVEPPTRQEIGIAAIFVKTAFPHIELTAKGQAALDFMDSTHGAGMG